jgi:hypothetical protein
MVTDGSETFRLDKLESEVVGGTQQCFESLQRQEISAKHLVQLWGTFTILSSRYQRYEVCSESIHPF